MLTVRRDYRELVPALRHRYDPNSAALARLRSQPRDVRLTIDANLQLRVATIVASYAGKAAGQAAAVVIDPDTGDLLASASYPGRSRPGRSRRRNTRRIRCWTGRATACIRRDPRSSW